MFFIHFRGKLQQKTTPILKHTKNNNFTNTNTKKLNNSNNNNNACMGKGEFNVQIRDGQKKTKNYLNK